MRIAPIQFLGALRKRLSDRYQTDNFTVEIRLVDNHPGRQVDQDPIRETMIEADHGDAGGGRLTVPEEWRPAIEAQEFDRD